MANPVQVALNQAAEIFGRTPLTTEASNLFYLASRAKSEEEFLYGLLGCLQTKGKFPAPRDILRYRRITDDASGSREPEVA